MVPCVFARADLVDPSPARAAELRQKANVETWDDGGEVSNFVYRHPSELFPAATRYSGVSLSLTLGTILGGAVSPAISAALFSATGNSSLITAYVTMLSLISWLCSLGLRETFRSDLAAGPEKAGPKGPALQNVT